MIQAKKKIALENSQKVLKAASEMAESATSHGKTYCVLRVSVGLDTSAVREAVVKVMEQKVTSSFLFF